MKITLLIDGGLGRVITSIPALEKFVKFNTECTIITYFWTPIIWGNKTLTPYVFDNQTKGNFDRIKDTKIIRPEPYYNSDYLNERISLADAFNQEINGDKDKMPIPKIYLNRHEMEVGNKVRVAKKKAIIALQPFGSTANITENTSTDGSSRSMSKDTLIALVKRLRHENFGLYLMTDKMIPFLNRDDFIDHYPGQIREIAATIANCDYFLGIDSSGQHIARSFNKPGTVLIGGTAPINISYPDFFNIIDFGIDRKYISYRICEFDNYLAEIENDGILDLNKEQINDFIENTLQHIKKSI